MNKQLFVTGLLCISIIGMLTAVILGSKNKNTAKNPSTQNTVTTIQGSNQTPILYYGNTCPHCAEVEAWIKENKIEEKISIVKKEVYENQQNSQELAKAAQSCNISTDNIGVPFLYTEGKCLVGSPDIIKYLSRKANL